MDTFTATTRILVSGNECDNSEDDGQSIVYRGGGGRKDDSMERSISN